MKRGRRQQGKIPGLVLGIFLFLAPMARSAPELARELFRDGEWAACRRELLREDPDPAPASLHAWMLGIAEMKSGHARDGRQRLTRLIDAPDASPALRGAAAFALGVEARRAGRTREAADYFAQTFLHAPTPELFAHGGCALYHLLQADRTLQNAYSTLWPQLESASAAWPPALHATHRLPRRRWTSRARRIAVMPFVGAVRFYQRQVGPAIGTRCQLYPSCSAFFMQAARAHGAWAIPMYGDRAIREPSIIQAQRQVTERGGRKLIVDLPEDRTHPRAARAATTPTPSLPAPLRRLADADP